MNYNFDAVIERRGTGCAKWDYYAQDVLPLWVADMDFRSPEPIIRALHERIDHGFFGYHFDSPQVRTTLVERMQRLYNWTIEPTQIHFLPNLVSAFTAACRAFAAPGEGVLMLTPVYMPFLSAPRSGERIANMALLAPVAEGHRLRYEIDFDALEAAITPGTRMLLMCSPHNPVGRVWQRGELERIADLCLRHDLIICSDEIHCDLVFDDHRHIPIASLAPEIADRTLTLMAPSKTFNMPTLNFAFAIAQNREVMKRFSDTTELIVPHPGSLGFTAAQAAYTECQPWLDELLAYLTANRDYVVDFVRDQLPGVRVTQPEATYLAWLDWRETGLPGAPYQFFLEHARVALNDGVAFGPGGEGFTRLNFGCPRVLLTAALERLAAALEKI